MNNFIRAIAGTAEGIKLQRAQNTGTAARLAQESLINDKNKMVQSLESRLTGLLDIGPDSGDSLRPVAKDFNAETWVVQVQDVKFSLKKAQEQLQIAMTTYNEWFREAPEAPAPTNTA